jgi:hypothetical protein
MNRMRVETSLAVSSRGSLYQLKATEEACGSHLGWSSAGVVLHLGLDGNSYRSVHTQQAMQGWMVVVIVIACVSSCCNVLLCNIFLCWLR